MQIALVSDLHGNWPAVEAVDRDIRGRGIDRVICLGDILGKGPSGSACIDWVRGRCEAAVMGNWDETIVQGEGEQSRWFAAQLTADRFAYLAALPYTHALTISGRAVLLYHGRPLTPIVYAESPQEDKLAAMAAFDAAAPRPDWVGFGDVHRAFVHSFRDGRTLFNVGSVGNSIGATRACYAVLSGEEGPTDAPISLQLVQLPYDVERAVAMARACAGLPKADAYERELRTGEYSR